MKEQLIKSLKSLYDICPLVQGWSAQSIKDWDGYSEHIRTMRRNLNDLVSKGRLGYFQELKGGSAKYYFIPDLGGICSKGGIWDYGFENHVQVIGTQKVFSLVTN